MATNGHQQSLGALEREVDEQRARVDRRLHEIQDRLSPGQLVDQVLRYTRHNGIDFASSLGNTVAANPVPTVLLGISLAWLMAGPKHPSNEQLKRPSFPYATASSGGLQRTRHELSDTGEWYSHFIDDAGKEYRAQADEAGRRTGHFIDEAGNRFGGFVDETGRRVENFRDEAGNMLADAADWASHTFQDAQDAIGQAAGDFAHAAEGVASDLQRRAGATSRSLGSFIHDQPLVAGALAFAAGAAVGAALPSTEQEDQLFGKEADALKREAKDMAGDLYEEGKRRAGDIYEDASESVGSAYQSAKSAALGSSDGQQPN